MQLFVLVALLAVAGASEVRAADDRDRDELHVVINLPAYRLDVVQGGETTRSYPVAIGKPSHPTPSGSFRVPHIEWNPWWTPPDSPWARGRNRTPPGPDNPMGRAKIFFRELYYIHGSPEAGSIGSAASHGCVRMLNEDVVALARLLQRYGSPDVSGEVLDRLEANQRETRTIRLTRPVRVDVVYELVEIRSGELVLHTDVYGRAGTALVREQAIQALIGAGRSPETVDGAQLDELVRESRRTRVSIPVDAIASG